MAKKDNDLHQLEIWQLKNLGKSSARMLADDGIQSTQQLIGLGAAASYLAVCHVGRKPSLNLLWAIAAAIKDIHWLELTDSEKKELKSELESLC